MTIRRYDLLNADKNIEFWSTYDKNDENENIHLKNIAATTDNGVIAILKGDETRLALVYTKDLEGNSFVASKLSTVASIKDGAMMLLKGSDIVKPKVTDNVIN